MWVAPRDTAPITDCATRSGDNARIDDAVVDHKINCFDMVNCLAPRDPASYPPDTWRPRYRDFALNTPGEQLYPIP